MARKLMIVMRPVAGGMWQHLVTLLDNLGDEYDPVVCCQDDPEQLEFLESRSIRTRIVPMPAQMRFAADVKAARLLRQAIRQERPDLIHSHGFHAGLITSVVSYSVGRPPHVCTLHGMAVLPGAGMLRRMVYGPLQRILVATTPRIITVTQAVRDEIPGGSRARKIVVISNGIDPERIRPKLSAQDARRELGVDGARPVVGCVSRLSPVKGVDDFVRMAAILAEARPKMTFVVVGDGEDADALRSLAVELGVADRIRFTGAHFPATDYMQLFDVTVIPSVLEGQSLAAIESLFMGKPIVSTSVGGLAEVVTPDVGRLVPPRSPDELAASVSGVLASGQAERMGARGKEMAAAQFTASKMVASTKKVYEDLLAASRRKS